MSKLSKLLVKDTLLLIAVGLPILLGIMLMRSAGVGTTAAEQSIFAAFHLGSNINLFRGGLIALMTINTLLAYRLIANWYGRRRSALSLILLASIPGWVLLQFNMPQLTLILAPLLLAMLAFDCAGRSQKPVLWYALSGISATMAWLQEPVGVSTVLAVMTLVMVVAKPRYIKHIARQALLIPIIMVLGVAAAVGASIKFNLGLQLTLADKLQPATHIKSLYALLATGPNNYRFGLVGVGIIPLPILLLAGLGAWQLFVQRKRPRNLFLLVFTLTMLLLVIPFTGLTLLLVMSFALIGVSIWAMLGIEYLHRSWQRIFPHNRLANNTADALIAALIAFMALYSFWYVAKAWTGNPQARMDVVSQWDGKL